MSEHTIQADEAIAVLQNGIKDFDSPGIPKMCMEKIADALSSLTTAIEQIEGQLSDLQNSTGDDPGIQISHLKDTVRGLEGRIENLERCE